MFSRGTFDYRLFSLEHCFMATLKKACFNSEVTPYPQYVFTCRYATQYNAVFSQWKHLCTSCIWFDQDCKSISDDNQEDDGICTGVSGLAHTK